MKIAVACILGGIVIVIAGCGAGIFMGVRAAKNEYSSVQFLAPGKATLVAKTPGDYTLWNDYQTVFEGKSYHGSLHLPSGWIFSITEDATGKDIPIQPLTTISVQLNSALSHSVGTVDLPRPGNYTISATGPDTRPFSISCSIGSVIHTGVEKGLFDAAVGVVLGAAVFLTGIVRIFTTGRKTGGNDSRATIPG